MGKEVSAQSYSREERQRYREKVHQDLDVFERMLNERAFDEEVPLTGLEIELNLIDDVGDPALKNAEVLEAIADPDFQTELGQFNLVTYRDGVEDTVHMALTRGEISPEEPTLVRVHNMEPLRDLFLVKQPGRWSLRAAMAEVAKAGSGVVLLLGNPLTGPELLAHLGKQPAPSPATYSTVGAGSQILRDLGVRKMRLMSAPMKFNAISGFDLEVVEYLPAE